ncbi:MAG: sulfatase-like hydrolase/transferase [Candidatus Omnitrophica bacterium]|nr:sulfatase-like hydrolase/transferase [Candidatus Omnitrophota bacterium]
MGVGFVGASIWPSLASAEESKRPNIILCMADDQGWGDMGYYDHPVLKTPNFDEASKNSLRFDHFYSAAPVCSPTRASVLTGRTPNRCGCFSWGHSIRPQEITIAEALKQAGYITGHFGKWHVGSVQKGSPVNPGNSGFDEWLSAPNFFDNDPILSREGVAEQEQGESSMVTVDAALEFIRKHSQDESPFFAVVWFGSPHNPHHAVERDREPYKDQDEKHQNFYGEITGMDRAFGKLREEVKGLGLRDNTLLWYCSDNGGLPNLGSTGGRGDKGDIYEGGLRVPAFIEWPERIASGSVTNLPSCTYDIYPTLLDLVGVEMEGQPPLDGISLLPLLSGQMENRGRPLGFWDYPAKGIRTPSAELMADLLEVQKEGKDVAHPELLRLDSGFVSRKYSLETFPGHAAWLDWPWKLHRIEKDDENTIRFQLYNLEDDPMEEKVVIQENGDRFERMRNELEAWQASVVRSLNGEDYEDG